MKHKILRKIMLLLHFKLPEYNNITILTPRKDSKINDAIISSDLPKQELKKVLKKALILLNDNSKQTINLFVNDNSSVSKDVTIKAQEKARDIFKYASSKGYAYGGIILLDGEENCPSIIASTYSKEETFEKLSSSSHRILMDDFLDQIGQEEILNNVYKIIKNDNNS